MDRDSCGFKRRLSEVGPTKQKSDLVSTGSLEWKFKAKVVTKSFSMGVSFFKYSLGQLY